MDIYSRKEALLRKYLNNDCSRDELDELLGYLSANDDTAYEGATADLWKNISEERKMDEKKAHALIKNAINAGKSTETKRYRSLPWYKLTAAAALILAIGLSLIFFIPQGKKQPALMAANPAVNQYKNDIKPGGTKAILKAGGSQMLLTERDTSFVLAGNKINIKQGDVNIAHDKPVLYTLITPRGGEYSVILSDGTKVWMNADSKLIYPSVFNGNTRQVQLTGEAYFDVKTDPDHPFIVHTNKQDIKVLGTEFNIKAYKDENTSVTTLINGKVLVNSKGKEIQLKQGQQAISDLDGNFTLKADADIKEIIAWKEGYFRFYYTDIHEIMRQLSRWYDVNVSYEKGVGHKEFLAFINRDNDISEVLEMLAGTGEIRFKIEGKNVTVVNIGQ